MSIHSKVNQWGNVSRFCVERMADYSELFSIELAQTRARLLREIIALVALAVAGLFTLSFLCIAIIATAWGTRDFLNVVWGVAVAWLALSVISFIAMRAQRPARSFHILQEEIRHDLQTVKEALK
jgi:uncharacterized membrane protein YqjE